MLNTYVIQFRSSFSNFLQNLIHSSNIKNIIHTILAANTLPKHFTNINNVWISLSNITIAKYSDLFPCFSPICKKLKGSLVPYIFK